MTTFRRHIMRFKSIYTFNFERVIRCRPCPSVKSYIEEVRISVVRTSQTHKWSSTRKTAAENVTRTNRFSPCRGLSFCWCSIFNAIYYLDKNVDFAVSRARRLFPVCCPCECRCVVASSCVCVCVQLSGAAPRNQYEPSVCSKSGAGAVKSLGGAFSTLVDPSSSAVRVIHCFTNQSSSVELG